MEGKTSKSQPTLLSQDSGASSSLVVDDEETKAQNKPKFQVDMGLIPEAQLKDEVAELQALGLEVFNQEDLEEGVMQQVDDAITKDEEIKKKNSLKKDLKTVNDEIRIMKHELASLTTQIAQLRGKGFGGGAAARKIPSTVKQKENKVNEMKALEEKKKKIQAKLDGKLPLFDENEKCMKTVLGSTGNVDRDRLIQAGEMTPFGSVVKHEHSHISSEPKTADTNNTKTSVKKDNFFDKKDKRHYANHTEGASNFPDANDLELPSDDEGDEWLPSDGDQLVESEDDGPGTVVKQEKDVKLTKKQKRKIWNKRKNRPIYYSNSEDSDEGVKLPKAKAIRKYRDDGLEDYYNDRMDKFQEVERKKQKLREAGKLEDSDDDEEFDGGLKVPGRIWSKLYKYQKTCVKWLWELHCQQAGGIVGDEMGLGKTIQAIAFLAAIKYSKLRNRNFSYIGLGPCLIVCPATVMHQWVKEFHTWWPSFRLNILHSSGTHVGKEKELVQKTVKHNGILVTSYTTLVIQQEHILPYNWHYIILDEGHKIRNPDAQATLVCKQFRTAHRVILSGSPIQNNLKELWSLMDFVFPGKLGTLPDFMQHFAVPIVQGGYSNATDIQVQTAYKCACVLRDTINPYLLRRMKADVKTTINLPGKNEQVLFCRLTEEQRDVYTEYLDSRECQEILSGRFIAFAGLIQLRKLCNHPDLSTGGPRLFKGDETGGDPSLEYGYWKRSGKMIVVEALLKLWKKQGHKALVFTQSVQMLGILETFVKSKGYTYVRMDGSTGISSRQPLVQKYNTNDNIYLFLLTTRVGGLGINLTGANRIIIYDPDWNPSTDMQARERAWRIGQKRQVTIYRLLTTGTIEEKIYHRQIFKQFLTNRVLKDPKQRRLFKTNDMYELFSLGASDDKKETETSAIFAGTGADVNVRPSKMNRFDKMKAEKKGEAESRLEDEDRIEQDTQASLNFDQDEINRMREMARKLSQKMGQGKLTSSESIKDSSETTKGNSGKVNNSDSGSDSKDKTTFSGSSSAHSSRVDKLKSYTIKKKSSSDNLSSGSNSARDSPLDRLMTEISKGKGNQSNKAIKTEIIHKRSREDERDSHRKHKKKKHKRKDAKFEGERIPNLFKVRDYKQSVKAEDGEAAKESDQMDNYVLGKLFKKTGIQGALSHDKIMEPGRPDYVIVETEAEKVAKEASQALKRSRLQCLPAKAGVPTWTGAHGGAKRPRFGQKKNTIVSQPGTEKPAIVQDKSIEKSGPSKSKDNHFDGSLAGSVQTNIETGASVSSAVSSTDLLNKMRVRNEVYTKPGTRNTENNDDNDDGYTFVSDLSALDLIKRMREFILFECNMIGQATTKEILDEFGPKLPPEDSAKFKSLLNSICDFQKKDGAGYWKLRGDYR